MRRPPPGAGRRPRPGREGLARQNGGRDVSLILPCRGAERASLANQTANAHIGHGSEAVSDTTGARALGNTANIMKNPSSLMEHHAGREGIDGL